jgi:hypothetical protein
MRIEAQHQTTRTELSTQNIPAQLAPVNCKKNDTIVSAQTTNKPSNIFARAWASIKSYAFKFWEWLKDLFSSCTLEETPDDIVQQMLENPKEYAASFVEHFEENWNVLIREAYTDTKKLKDKFTDKNNKKALNEFFGEVKAKLEKTKHSDYNTLMDQAQEMRAVVREALSGINGRLDLTKFAPHKEWFKSNIAKYCPALLSFFSQVTMILKSSKQAKEQDNLNALVHLFGAYFPSIVNEMKQGNANAFSRFIEAFFNIQSVDKDVVIALLKKEFAEQTKEVETTALDVCLENDGLILNDKITSEHYAKTDFGLKTPVNYKMALLEALTPEQFQVFVGLFVKDENRAALMSNIFSEIKGLDEPFTFKRLNEALDTLDDILGSLENGKVTVS